jgi:RimJ/RimL family protein N-acetyltransferase
VAVRSRLHHHAETRNVVEFDGAIEPIPGKSVFLRRPEPEDLAVILSLLNDPAVTSSTEFVGVPVSRDMNVDFHRGASQRDAFHLAIIDREGGRAVGVTMVHRIDWRTQTAHHGVKMLREVSGQGFATDACTARNTFLFFQLGLRKLVWRALDFNVASQRLAERLGYTLEGRERQAVQRDGRWCDVLTYGLLRSEAEQMESYAAYRRLIVPVDVHAAPEASA